MSESAPRSAAPLRCSLATRADRLLVAVMAASFIGTAPAIAAETESVPVPGPIRIGLITPLTGGSADFGTSMLQGAELAVRQINTIGGYLGRPLELVVRDDHSDPATGRAAAIELVTKEHVTATIGFCNTGVAVKSLDVFESNKSPLIVPCATGTAITHTTPAVQSMVFHVAPYDGIASEFLVNEIVQRRKLTRVAVLADTTGYGDGGVKDVTAHLKQRGLEPVQVIRFAANAPSLRTEMEAARAAGAQALIVFTVGPGQAAAAQARAALRWDVPYFAPWTLSFRSVLDAAGPAALEGTMMTQTVLQDSSNEARTSFIMSFTKATDHKPIGSLMAAAQTYDSVHILLRAIFASRGDLSGPSLKMALENPREAYRGVVTTSDHEAFTMNMLWLGTWHGGELHYYYANDARLTAAVRHKQDH